MTIRYSNGHRSEAILLSRAEDKMRVVLQGSEDVVELNRINGAWISDECEAVQVEFAWSREAGLGQPELEDCICSHELAANLIHLLFAGENQIDALPPVERVDALPVFHQVV
jgi:hypothetical protein